MAAYFSTVDKKQAESEALVVERAFFLPEALAEAVQWPRPKPAPQAHRAAHFVRACGVDMHMDSNLTRKPLRELAQSKAADQMEHLDLTPTFYTCRKTLSVNAPSKKILRTSDALEFCCGAFLPSLSRVVLTSAVLKHGHGSETGPLSKAGWGWFFWLACAWLLSHLALALWLCGCCPTLPWRYGFARFLYKFLALSAGWVVASHCVVKEKGERSCGGHGLSTGCWWLATGRFGSNHSPQMMPFNFHPPAPKRRGEEKLGKAEHCGYEQGMILAYESGSRLTEPDRERHNFPRVEQFQNWFMASAPGNPVLRRALGIIREKFIWKVQKTVDLTGPGTLSDAVHEFLTAASSEQGILAEISRRTSFSKKYTFPSEKLYNSGNQTVWLMAAGRVGAKFRFHDDPVRELLQHTFAGSWKPPGMTRRELAIPN
eukprot:s2496_g8.t1